jgi:hypothetical protein
VQEDEQALAEESRMLNLNSQKWRREERMLGFHPPAKSSQKSPRREVCREALWTNEISRNDPNNAKKHEQAEEREKETTANIVEELLQELCF